MFGSGGGAGAPNFPPGCFSDVLRFKIKQNSAKKLPIYHYLLFPKRKELNQGLCNSLNQFFLKSLNVSFPSKDFCNPVEYSMLYSLQGT